MLRILAALIDYTKAFRRMQSKTQVLASNAGDHYRTRLTHSLEVQQLAGSMADALGLNRDLAEAIAIGKGYLSTMQTSLRLKEQANIRTSGTAMA